MAKQRRVDVSNSGGEIGEGVEVSVGTLRRYAGIAARSGWVRPIPSDDRFEAGIEGFPGVWAVGATKAEALGELVEVVFDWVVVKIRDGDRDLPVVADIDLNVL